MSADTTLSSARTPAHAITSFDFLIDAPLADAAPLFGPEGERRWAGPEWDPSFIYPLPSRDMEGAVFTTRDGEHASLWINTRFDLCAGRMQYVVIVPQTLTTTIDVALAAADPDGTVTRVAVTYSRTALSAAANAHLAALVETDRGKGVKWGDAIADMFRTKADVHNLRPGISQ